MSEKNVELGVRLKTEQAHAKLQAFGRGMQNTFSNINRMADATSRHFGMVATTISALGSGLVLKKLFSVSDFAKLDDSMIRMQGNVKMTAAELKKFRGDLTNLISSEGMPIEEAADQAQKLAKAYKPDEILKILEAADGVADVTKESLSDSVAAITRIMKIYHLGADEAKDIAASIVTSGGALGPLSTMMQRGVMKGSASKEYKDILAIVGAMKSLRVESPRVVMAIEQILDAVQSNPKAFKGAGIDIFKTDPATGKKVKKSVIEILQELQPKIEKFKALVSEEDFKKNIEATLGPGSAEGLKFLMDNLKTIEEARKKQDNATQHAAPKFDAANNTWEESFGKVKAHVALIKEDVAFIYRLIKQPVQWFADNPTATKKAAWLAATAAIGLGGGMLYQKGKGVLTDMKSTGAGVVKGKALEAVAGVTPVYVTNWPNTFGPLSAPGSAKTPPHNRGVILDQYGRPIPNTTTEQPQAKGSKLAGRFEALSQGIFAAAIGYQVGGFLTELGGGLSGAMTGGKYKGEGFLGSLIYDIMNPETPEQLQQHNPDMTLQDGDTLVGSKLLELVNNSNMAQLQQVANQEPKVDNKIDIQVNVDQNGRAITTVEGKNTEVQVMAANRGSFR